MDTNTATQITDALSNGAIAAASGVATTLITDTYGGLKALVVDRFKRRATIDALEEDPSSDAQKAAVADALSKSGAADDPDVQALARQLATALAGVDAANARAMGLDIEDLQAVSVRLADIVSDGTAVHIRRTSVAGAFEAEGIRSGQEPTGKN